MLGAVHLPRGPRKRSASSLSEAAEDLVERPTLAGSAALLQLLRSECWFESRGGHSAGTAFGKKVSDHLAIAVAQFDGLIDLAQSLAGFRIERISHHD